MTVAREGAAVGVGGRDREVPRCGWTVAAAPGAVGRGPGSGGHPVPGLGEADHLVAASEQLCDLQRGLVGLRAGGQQQRLLQWLRCGLGQGAGQIDHRLAEHAAEQVIQPGDVLGDRVDDVGVGVAEDGAHLPRGEVENGTTFGVIDERALRSRDHRRRKRAGVADQMPIHLAPEPVLGHASNSLSRSHRPAHRHPAQAPAATPCPARVG